MTDIVTYCDVNTCEDCPRYGDDCDGDKRVEHTDYISRADAIEALSRSSVYAWSTEQDLVAHSWAIRILQSLPSANAKQGKWLTDKGKSLMICSVCGTLFNKHTDFFDFEEFANFCPYCGAIMKGGAE